MHFPWKTLGKFGVVCTLVIALAALASIGCSSGDDRQDNAFLFPQPGYLPEGFWFLNAQTGYDTRAANIITLNYRSSGGALAITEFEQPRVAVPDIYLNPGRVTEKRKTGRYEVVLFDPDSQPKDLTAMTAALRWQKGPLWFEVKGNIALEEMIRVADSLIPGGLE